MALLFSVLEQGLIYAILALGVYITFSVLDFPDMSVDATFPLGAAVTAVMMNAGFSPLLTLPAAILAGALAGAVTGIIHVKGHVSSLLSGIITMTGLYSVNLRIAGKANLPFFSMDTLFKNDLVAALPVGVRAYAPLLILLALTLLVKCVLDWFFATRAGYLLRATGDNPQVVTALAKDGGMQKILGLSLSNALVALAGCIMCQHQRYFDISMGTGTLVIAVASVIIGMNLLRGAAFLKPTGMVIVGSILYKACVALALSAGLQPTDLKLITAVLLLAILVVGRQGKGKVKRRA